MLAAVGVLLMMAAAGAVQAARPALDLRDITCPTADKYVYPYWSFCWNPAELSTGYVYGTVSRLGSLAPEYDESNSTYYVRLSDEGAKYVAVGIDGEYSGPLLVHSPVYIFNSETNRALKWRQEGVDEYFLIEEEVSSVTDGAQFIFLPAFLPLACPSIFPPPQCQAYYLVSYPGSTPSPSIVFAPSGLLAYPEGGATYIKAGASGSKGDLPLLVTRSATSTNSDILPLPKIRTVTDHHGA